jgi:hypothetical protein
LKAVLNSLFVYKFELVAFRDCINNLLSIILLKFTTFNLYLIIITYLSINNGHLPSCYNKWFAASGLFKGYKATSFGKKNKYKKKLKNKLCCFENLMVDSRNNCIIECLYYLTQMKIVCKLNKHVLEQNIMLWF